MRAVLLVGYGGVDKLEVGDVPEPVARPGELKVRLVASSVNPIDLKERSGALRQLAALDLPAILGRDASGEAIQVRLIREHTAALCCFRFWSSCHAATESSGHFGMSVGRSAEATSASAYALALCESGSRVRLPLKSPAYGVRDCTYAKGATQANRE